MRTFSITLLFILGAFDCFCQDTLRRVAYAKAPEIDGIFIFLENEPAHKYEVLGSVTNMVPILSVDFKSMLDRLVYFVKRKYPEAEGAIVTFYGNNPYEAKAIKFIR